MGRFQPRGRHQEDSLAQLRSAAAKAEIEATAARHATLETDHKTVELSIKTSDGDNSR